MIASWRIADIVGAYGARRIALGAIVPLLIGANCRTLKTGGLNGIVPRFALALVHCAPCVPFVRCRAF